MELDSKRLFIKAEFLSRQVDWVNEWEYIGLVPGLEEHFAKILDISFENERVVLIRGRNDSATLYQREIHNLLLQGLCNADFKIWNLDFTSVLEFNKIGVYRKGKVS